MSSPSTPGANTPSSSFLSFFLAWCFILGLAAWAIFELKAPAVTPASSPPTEFSAERALAHVRAIARVQHPLGSQADVEAREYVVTQLVAMGMNPQVVEGVGIYNGFGALIAGKTHDVLARLSGTNNTKTIMLMAHYDSVPSGPGAADDAAGVAAILETLRALKAGTALNNDLIVLITDGEEPGLLGAEAFAASNHPWLKDVGLIMNFEARGNHGPSLLFETGVNNAALIDEVARAAPYPTGSSLFYALYKQLPNDTDFSVFRRQGIPGLNFAFGGHLEAYHTWLDTPDRLDLTSLQHHGSYALPLVRRFGQLDLTYLKPHGDDVFFNGLGSSLIAYSEHWVVRGEVAATILLIVAIVLGVTRSGVRIGHLLLTMCACLGLLLVVSLIMTASGWLLLQFGPSLLLGDTPANSLLLIGLTLLGAFVGCILVRKVLNRLAIQELLLAGLVITCVLSWAFAIWLPAGSYLLFWPLLLTTIGLVLAELVKALSPAAQLVSTLVGAATTILLFAPVAYLLYVFLTLNPASIAAVGLLVGLFLMLSVPLMRVASRSTWPLIVAAAICVGTGIAQSHPSALHPREDNLLYSLNTDSHAAVWVSYDHMLDSYTTQFLGGKAVKPEPVPDFLGGSKRPVLSAPAPVGDLRSPIADIKSDEQNGDTHNIRMNVRSTRDAHSILLRFDPSVKPVSVKISGRTMSPKSGDLILLLHGMGAQGADLELALKAPSGAFFWVTDYSVGLPTTQRRSSELIAGQGSDETLVTRKYTLARLPN